MSLFGEKKFEKKNKKRNKKQIEKLKNVKTLTKKKPCRGLDIEHTIE